MLEDGEFERVHFPLPLVMAFVVAGAAVALARVALRRGCGRLEWTVLDWNRPAIRFYRGLGARLHTEWVLTRLTDAPLRRLARSARPR